MTAKDDMLEWLDRFADYSVNEDSTPSQEADWCYHHQSAFVESVLQGNENGSIRVVPIDNESRRFIPFSFQDLMKIGSIKAFCENIIPILDAVRGEVWFQPDVEAGKLETFTEDGAIYLRLKSLFALKFVTDDDDSIVDHFEFDED